MSLNLAGVILYVVVLFAIGIWVSRKISNVTDYVVAGRTLGPGLVMFSVFATFFGAEAIVGTGGAVYENGIAGAEADPFGYGLAILIVAAVFARALWRRGLLTFADFFRERFGPGIEKLVVLVLLQGSLFWAAAQIRAFGQVVGHATGLPVEAAILAGAVVVAGYSLLGGMLADAWTDFVQGIAIIAGLAVLAAAVTLAAGGLPVAVASVPAERLTWTPGANGWLSFAETLAIPICGTIVAVEMVSRILGARSAQVARGGGLAGGTLYIVVGLLPVYIALIGSTQMAGLEDPERIIPGLAEQYLPPILYVVFVGALISAILSTVDTVLLASAAQLSHNLLFRIVRPSSPTRELWMTRLTMLALAVVACGLALSAESVKDLVETASAAGSSGIVVVTVFGLFTRFGGPRAATATILVGSLSWLLLGQFAAIETPFLAAVCLSLLTYLVVAYSEGREWNSA
jgi:SSS family solute:Na+ symporter